MPLEANLIANIQGCVVAAFKHAGYVKHATDQALREARKRIGFDRLTKQQRREWSIESSWDFHRWMDDGGFCLNFMLDADLEA